MVKYNLDTFIKKAQEVHGNKYDYSKVEYINSQTKVCVICPEHGEFWQAPYSHLCGSGCPSCHRVKKRTTETFIDKAIEVHGERYDYSKTKYINKRSSVIITCKIHGDFEQNANRHLRGQGCPLCGKKYAIEYRKSDYMHFIKESINRFGDVYEFPNIEELYENSHSKILIKCKKCGSIFEKIACDHLTSPFGGCLRCYSKISKSETEIFDFLVEKLGNDNVKVHDRTILDGKEIDIFIPSKNIAIEYNGIFWHSEKFNKNRNYHIAKTEECKTKGIRLIQIFEDEYVNHKEIIFSKISHLLCIDKDKTRIYARKCTIRAITFKEASSFLNKNHIQGSSISTKYLGCFYENILVGVMSFKKENNKLNKWELTRFATDNNYVCCGIGGKLFKHFIENYHPEEIKSFADRRWTINDENNLYIKLGFKFDKYTLPDYRYIKGNDCKRYHKFGFRKSILSKKYGLNIKLTETEMTENLGFYRIWDCGLIKYIWKNEK